MPRLYGHAPNSQRPRYSSYHANSCAANSNANANANANSFGLQNPMPSRYPTYTERYYSNSGSPGVPTADDSSSSARADSDPSSNLTAAGHASTSACGEVAIAVESGARSSLAGVITVTRSRGLAEALERTTSAPRTRRSPQSANVRPHISTSDRIVRDENTPSNIVSAPVRNDASAILVEPMGRHDLFRSNCADVSLDGRPSSVDSQPMRKDTKSVLKARQSKEPIKPESLKRTRLDETTGSSKMQGLSRLTARAVRRLSALIPITNGNTTIFSPHHPFMKVLSLLPHNPALLYSGEGGDVDESISDASDSNDEWNNLPKVTLWALKSTAIKQDFLSQVFKRALDNIDQLIVNAAGDSGSSSQGQHVESCSTSTSSVSSVNNAKRDRDKRLYDSVSGGGKGDDGNNDEDSDDENNRKRRRKSRINKDQIAGLKLACPYFKHNPGRHSKHRACAGPGWHTIHRVK